MDIGAVYGVVGGGSGPIVLPLCCVYARTHGHTCAYVGVRVDICAGRGVEGVDMSGLDVLLMVG